MKNAITECSLSEERTLGLVKYFTRKLGIKLDSFIVTECLRTLDNSTKELKLTKSALINVGATEYEAKAILKVAKAINEDPYVRVPTCDLTIEDYVEHKDTADLPPLSDYEYFNEDYIPYIPQYPSRIAHIISLSCIGIYNPMCSHKLVKATF